MEFKYLFLSAATATFGFMIWYALSASLRLPNSFQIQYDINAPYVFRIYVRRTFMFICYALIPILLIRKWHVLGNVSWQDLGISFAWTNDSTVWVAGLAPVIIIYNFITMRKDANLVENPEIRVSQWSRKILFLSAITWILQVFAMEFLFRGILLQSLRLNGVSDLFAVIICTGFYAMTHYFKQNRISVYSIPYGFLACYIVILTGSIFPVIIIHLINVFSIEWFSLRNHPEINLS